MKKERIIIVIGIFLFFLVFTIVTINDTYGIYKLTRDVEVKVSSAPLYFDANTSNNNFDYSEKITIPVNVYNGSALLFSQYDLEYEISLKENDKFDLNNVVTGKLLGNSFQQKIENIEIIPKAGQNAGANEEVTISVKLIKPYSKEVEIPVVIEREVDNIYSYMMSQSTGTDQNIDFQVPVTKETSGIYMNYETQSSKYPVYYYRGLVNNSVIFGSSCWQIVRTTEYGGVKLIYDGIVSNGQCTDTHDRIGSEEFENKVVPSPADVGYMYGFEPNVETISKGRNGDLKYPPIELNDMIKVGFFYGKDLTWDATSGTYKISGESVVNENLNNLRSEIRHKEYYTCLSSNDTCSTVYYITHTGNVSDNGDGTYTLTEFDGIPLSNGVTLEEAKKPSETSKIQPGLLYGNDVTYDGSNYTLIDTIKVDDLDILEDSIKDKYHYTCLNSTGTCSNVYYIYYNSYGTFENSGSGLFSIRLNGTKNITDELDKMLSGSSNEFSTHAKQYIDSWFTGNGDYNVYDVSKYVDDLDDVVWCNERTIAGYHGWDKDTDNHSHDNKYLHFTAYKRIVEDKLRPILTCSNRNNSFTVSEANGNGDLDYPVGMLTADEMILAGGVYLQDSETYLNASRDQISMTAFYISDDHARMFFMTSSGMVSSAYTSSSPGLRPVIALKENFKIVSGTGETTNPFIIEKY